MQGDAGSVSNRNSMFGRNSLPADQRSVVTTDGSCQRSDTARLVKHILQGARLALNEQSDFRRCFRDQRGRIDRHHFRLKDEPLGSDPVSGKPTMKSRLFRSTSGPSLQKAKHFMIAGLELGHAIKWLDCPADLNGTGLTGPDEVHSHQGAPIWVDSTGCALRRFKRASGALPSKKASTLLITFRLPMSQRRRSTNLPSSTAAYPNSRSVKPRAAQKALILERRSSRVVILPA